MQLPSVDGYTILGHIGAGGMGSVWKATQNSTKRVVALKLLPLAALGSTRAQSRFQREVELAAGLEHPCIATVYESGLDRGLYYYAMEFVEGVPLDRYCRERNMGIHQVVSLMTKVCEAAQYAHQRGVIHRDLKPDNILVTNDGLPKLLDFGLAKTTVKEDQAVSVAGDIFGTLRYMSPEQARGETESTDTRSDVYSLGVILYFLITGKYPHESADSVFEALRRIGTQEPRRPREADARVDIELEAVILKAISLEADDRYATAGGLAEDLQKHEDGEMVSARPFTIAYFMGKKIRKHRYRVAAGSALLVALILATIFYVQEIRTQRQRAVEARNVAEQQRQIAEHNELMAGEQRALAVGALKRLVFSVQKELSEDMVQAKLQAKLLGIAADGLSRINEDSAYAELKTDQVGAGAAIVAGDIRKAQGRMKEAIIEYERALTALGANKKPPLPVYLHDIGVTRTRLAQIYAEERQIKAARGQLDEAQNCFNQLPEGSIPASRALSDRLALLLTAGDINTVAGMHVEALKNYTEAAGLLANSAAVPDGSESGRLKSVCLKKMISAQLAVAAAEKDEEKAKSAAEAAKSLLEADREWVRRNPSNRRYVRELSISLRLNAQIRLFLRDGANAISFAKECIQITQNLLEALPDRSELQVDLALAYQTMGDALLLQSDTVAAADAFNRGLRSLESPNAQADSIRVTELRSELKSRVTRLQSSTGKSVMP